MPQNAEEIIKNFFVLFETQLLSAIRLWSSPSAAQINLICSSGAVFVWDIFLFSDHPDLLEFC